MSLREGSKVVLNSTAKEVEVGEGCGRPMERAGKWVEEAMRKARPSPEGQEGEERMEKEAVELVWWSRKQMVKKVIIGDTGEGLGCREKPPCGIPKLLCNFQAWPSIYNLLVPKINSFQIKELISK